MHNPKEFHWQLVKRILRYIKATMAYGLPVRPSSLDHVVAYSNADWAGCPDISRSTMGHCVFLGNTLVS